MQVEIWSDVAWPWRAVGKRRSEAALGNFAHADDVRLRWRSFELDPSVRSEARGSDDVDDVGRLAAKDGCRFRFDRSRPGNTFDAHRLLHLAADRDLQDRVKERFLAGYLEAGVPIGDPEAVRARGAGDACVDGSCEL